MKYAIILGLIGLLSACAVHTSTPISSTNASVQPSTGFNINGTLGGLGVHSQGGLGSGVTAGASFGGSSVSAKLKPGAWNTWRAGLKHRGFIGLVRTGMLVWKCRLGVCIVRGPYGSDLNMSVCQQLSAKVGGLAYYSNTAGKMWSQQHNQYALNQCNQGR
ncbi:MAG: hypothetical protein AAGF06_02450 [Pseudomonadota bacterium]